MVRNIGFALGVREWVKFYPRRDEESGLELPNPLEWPEVKSNPLAVARIAWTLREMARCRDFLLRQ